MTQPLLPHKALDTHTAVLGKTGSKSCLVCGAGFTPTKKYPQQRFCSRRCGLKTTLSPDHNARVAKETAQRRGDAQRGRGEGKTYLKLYGRHAHRVIAEQKIGRPLRPGEVVHHIDGNKRNNDPANLEVLPSQSVHTSLHFKGRPSPLKGRKKK